MPEGVHAVSVLQQMAGVNRIGALTEFQNISITKTLNNQHCNRNVNEN